MLVIQNPIGVRSFSNPKHPGPPTPAPTIPGAYFLLDILRAQAYSSVMKQLTTSQRSQVVRCLVEGNSIRSTVRITGVAKNTIVRLLGELGCACAAYHNRAVRNLKVRRLKCDEIWECVGAKAGTGTREK